MNKRTLLLFCVGCLAVSLTASAADKKKTTTTTPAPTKKTETIPNSTEVAAEKRSAPEKRRGLEEQVSGQGYGMAGCGIGSIVFADKPGMIQIIAATLNGTAGSQTFGITSGTSK